MMMVSVLQLLLTMAATLERSEASFAPSILSKNERTAWVSSIRPRTKSSFLKSRTIRAEKMLYVSLSPNPVRTKDLRPQLSTNNMNDPSDIAAAIPPLRPLVVCGPSGVGKGTIIERFMEEISSAAGTDLPLPTFGFTVSHTTRAPRPGEVDGVHYHFCTHEFMQEKIDVGSFFVEHAEVHGNLYGTSFQSMYDVSMSDDVQCLLDVDVQGVRSIKGSESRQRQPSGSMSTLPELAAYYVFVAPPSLSTLRDRLVARGTETPESLERRFANAERELDFGLKEGNFDAVVVNDDLDRACAEFLSIVKRVYAS